MGLVDKVLEHHLHWLQLKVEKLTGEEQMVRQRYRNSITVLAISQRNLDNARAQLALLNSAEGKIEVREAQVIKNIASTTNTKNKKAFETLAKK